MQRMVLGVLIGIGLLVGFSFGLRANPQLAAAAPAIQETSTYSLINIREQVPVSLTLAVPNGTEMGTVELPMTFEYGFTLDLVPTAPTFAAVPDVQPLDGAQVMALHKQDDIRYDPAGIPYILTAPEDLELSWGSDESWLNEGAFTIEGTITNHHRDRNLVSAKIFVTAYDLNQKYLNTTDNTFSNPASEDKPISPGGSGTMFVSFDEEDGVPFREVGFYRVHVEALFKEPLIESPSRRN